jgi:hypothetical protein
MLVSLLASALAAPGHVPVAGLVFDAGGAGLEGTHGLTLRLVDLADQSVDHEETVQASLVGGRFAVQMSLDLDKFHLAELSLAVAVDGGAFSDAQPLGTAPYAASARRAELADSAATLGSLAPADVLTRTDAASTYLTQTSAGSTYLTQAAAGTTYLTQASAGTTYLTQAAAGTTYLTQASAGTTYLTQAAAGTTYLTQANAGTTYLTQANAGTTYLTQAAASAYIPHAALHRIDLMNIHPNGSGSGFFSITNNSDGGGTTWSPTSDSTLIINGNSCGGSHGGNWGHQIWLEPGTYKIVGQSMPLTTHTCIHGNTPTANYGFTLQIRWDIGSGSATVKLDTSTSANTWVPFESAPFTVASAGFVQPTYASNGYAGVKASYIRGLSLLRVKN